MRDDRPSCIDGWFSQRDVKPGVFCGVACFLKSKIHHFQQLPTVSGTVPNNGFRKVLWGFAPANVMCYHGNLKKYHLQAATLPKEDKALGDH